MGDIAKDINSKFPNDWVRALINIKYTANFLDNIGNAHLKPFEISVQQYNILRILRGAGEPLSMKVVRERMIEKSPNTTRLVDKLCQKELVLRVSCAEDKRAVKIQITKKGLEMIDAIPIEQLENQLRNLSQKEVQHLNTLLDKIR